MSGSSPQSTWRRWAQGCALAVIACFATCYACTKTDAWQRLNGSVLAKGTNSLTARGAMSLDWPDSRVLLMRAYFHEPDGYYIEVGGDSLHQLTYFFTFTTRFRPHPGVYELEARKGNARPETRYIASLSLGGDEGLFNGVEVGFKTDSGRLTISPAIHGLDGNYVVFMSGIPPGGTKTRGQIVVRGQFHVE